MEKQVKKVERTYELKDKLNKIYKEYLKRERTYLDNEKKKLEEEKLEPQKEHDALESELRESQKNLSKNKGENTGLKELIEIKGLLEKSQKEKNRLERESWKN